MGQINSKKLTKNQVSVIKMNGDEVKVQDLGNNERRVILPELIPLSYEELRDAIRLRIVNEVTGKPIKIPKAFLNTEEWVRISDEDLYRELFSIEEMFVLNSFDEWAVFVRKTSKRLLKSKELLEKAKEVLKANSKELIVYLVSKRKDIDRNPETYISGLNIYELEALVSEMNESTKKPGSSKSGAN
ncbi:MAG: hypothetical protein EOM56_09270 [Deltaproteobacteria bacterium]|nr:hypothetical protein [Deltaproteobacteria bacterium]